MWTTTLTSVIGLLSPKTVMVETVVSLAGTPDPPVPTGGTRELGAVENVVALPPAPVPSEMPVMPAAPPAPPTSAVPAAPPAPPAPALPLAPLLPPAPPSPPAAPWAVLVVKVVEPIAPVALGL